MRQIKFTCLWPDCHIRRWRGWWWSYIKETKGCRVMSDPSPWAPDISLKVLTGKDYMILEQRCTVQYRKKKKKDLLWFGHFPRPHCNFVCSVVFLLLNRFFQKVWCILSKSVILTVWVKRVHLVQRDRSCFAVGVQWHTFNKRRTKHTKTKERKKATERQKSWIFRSSPAVQDYVSKFESYLVSLVTKVIRYCHTVCRWRGFLALEILSLPPRGTDRQTHVLEKTNLNN